MEATSNIQKWLQLDWGFVFNICSTLLHCVQDELGVSRELMYNLPLEKKWELYLSKQKVKHKLIVI